jgi:hypothetical protein
VVWVVRIVPSPVVAIPSSTVRIASTIPSPGRIISTGRMIASTGQRIATMWRASSSGPSISATVIPYPWPGMTYRWEDHDNPNKQYRQ